MVKFEGIGQQIHGPLLALPTQHGLQLLLIEAAQRIQGQHLLKPRPAHSTVFRLGEQATS